MLVQILEVHVDDLCHQLPVWELDVVEYAAAQEGVGQLLLRIGGDNDDGAVLGGDGASRLRDVELHPIQLPQPVSYTHLPGERFFTGRAPRDTIKK